MSKTWHQVRPDWCPHKTCQFKRRVTDTMCTGQLPEPAPHDGDFNTHRLCLNGTSDSGGVFDLQINKSDVWWFRWLFEAIFPSALEAKLSKMEDALEHCGYDPTDCIDCGGPPHNEWCRFWKLRDVVPILFALAEEDDLDKLTTQQKPTEEAMEEA